MPLANEIKKGNPNYSLSFNQKNHSLRKLKFYLIKRFKM